MARLVSLTSENFIDSDHGFQQIGFDLNKISDICGNPLKVIQNLADTKMVINGWPGIGLNL